MASSLPISNAPRITPQPQVDAPATDVDPGAQLPQTLPAAQSELKGWLAGRAAERRAHQGLADAGAVAPAAPVQAPAALQVISNIHASFDRLEGQLKGLPPSMRDALVNAMATGQPPPAQLAPVADLAMQTANDVAKQLASLPEDARANVVKLIESENAWPLSDALINAGPDPTAEPATPPAPSAPVAPAQPQAPAVPGQLGQALAQAGEIDNPVKMDAIINAAKADGIAPDQLADQLISGQGPIAQAMLPHMNVPQFQRLGAFLDPKGENGKKYMQRLDGLQALAVQRSGANRLPQNPNLLSGADMRKLIAGGKNPLDIAQALVSNTGSPPRSAMTLDALNALESAMVPASNTDRATYTKLVDGLQALQAGMPATAGQIPAQLQTQARQAAVAPPSVANPLLQTTGVPQPLRQPVTAAPGLIPPGFQNPAGPLATGMAATANAGFMPTGRTALDLANAIGQMPTYSPAEQALLNQITDPKQRAMQELQMQMQQQALIATTLSNIANLRHDMQKTVANNIRA